MHRSLESTLESNCTKYASDKGVLCLKLYKIIGIPDKLFCYSGAVIFVEFKRLGEKPRPIQLHWHNLLRKQNFKVYVVDNFKQFKKVIQDEFFS